MKSKLLPIGLFTIILGIATILLATGLSNSPQLPDEQEEKAINDVTEYFTQIRRNQNTRRVDPIHELQAREFQNQTAFKSGNSLGLNWQFMGPDNAPGVVRALVFDKMASSNQSLILAGITGGIWRTDNLGATWSKLNQAGQNLKVTSLIQDDEGNIYAATGDGFCSNDIQYSQNNIYYGGIVGEGIFKSPASDRNNFTLLPATKPQISVNNDTVDFAYVYKLEFDQANKRLYAATNTGLWFSDNRGDSWMRVTKYQSDSITYGVTLQIDSVVYCNSYQVQGNEITIQGISKVEIDTLVYNKVEQSRIANVLNFGKIQCTSVSVGASGVVMATFNNRVYVSEGGNDPIFKNVSSNPSNIHFFTREVKSFTTNLTLIDTLNVSFTRGSVNFTQETPFSNLSIPKSPFSFANQGRSQIAIAPSNDNVYYAVCSDAIGYMENMYMSTDRGETWEVVFPGGSTSSLLPFRGTSCFNMELKVFPNDPFRVLLGGDNLWLGKRLEPGKYYDWGAGPLSQSFVQGLPSFLPASHHNYLFFPGSNSKFAVATNKGISFGTFTSTGVSFQQIVRGLGNSQVYTLGISGNRNTFLAGVQSNGVQYVSGLGNTPETGENVYGVTGGSCKMSIINPSAFMLGDNNGNMNRTSDKGLSFSLNFTSPNTNLFISPFAVWENFNDERSSTTVKFFADRTYHKGETILVRSANKAFEGDKGYPFTAILDVDSLVAGDSINIKDIVQSKFFIATHNAVYMTREIVKFDSIVTFNNSLAGRRNMWKLLQTANAFSKPSALAVSACGNYLFVGTENGRIYRIANIQNAFDKASGDMDSPFFVMSRHEFIPPQFTGRYITSISIDQHDPNHIIITLGNYGNQAYVYQSKNALSPVASVTFTNITTNLPAMPVYSSIIEMNNSNIGIIGTELGVYSTTGLLSGTPEWTFEPGGVGKAMVVSIQQQTVYKAGFVIESPDPNVQPVHYPAVNNYGDIYIATFGRGVFRDDSFHMPVGIEEYHQTPTSTKRPELLAFPNPVTSLATINFEIQHSMDVTLYIYDMSGKIAKQYQIGNLSAGQNEFTFDRTGLNSGVYLMSLQSSGNLLQRGKFIVK